MKPDNENAWWKIFTTEGTSKDYEDCLMLPVNAGPKWHKDLVNLYCPCRSGSDAYECQLVLI